MNINQISPLVGDLVKQALGEDGVQSVDLTSIVSMGDAVISSSTNRDNFLHVLVDRIARTIVSMRPYSREMFDIIMNTFEYGAILQKITVLLMEAQNSSQWNLTEGQSVDQYVVTKPTVKQKLFEGVDTWEMPITIPDIQLKSAFTSYESMAAFIDAIFMALSNSLNLQLERVGAAAVCNYIAEKLYFQADGATGIHAIHLLQEYNSDTSSTLTAAEALHNTDFLKWASRTINLFIKRLGRMSQLFNTEQYQRFTPRDYVRVNMLADFTTAVTSYLQADTFHNELTALPNYREVLYWQGSGQEYGFGETSLIEVTTSSGNTVKQDGVVCLLNDIEAIGMTMDNIRMTSSPHNARGEYTNFFQKADIRYYNDLSENGIVFTITDTPFTIPSPPEPAPEEQSLLNIPTSGKKAVTK